MKLLIVLSSLFLVAVIAVPLDSTPAGRHHGNHGGHHATHAPWTEEQKAKFEKDIQEKIAQLSPEAQVIAKKIHEIRKSEQGKEAHEKIEALKAGASESVKKELDTLHKHHHGKHHGHGKGGKRTTVKA